MGSVMGIYKTATSSCVCRGCEKGVGSQSLCLRFSSETQVSISHRHTQCLCHGKAESQFNPTSPPSGPKSALLICWGRFINPAVSDVYILTFVGVFSLIVQLDESPFVNGKITHKITVVPTANLTVSCTVSNEFGTDSKAINVSSCKYKVVAQASRLPPLPKV